MAVIIQDKEVDWVISLSLRASSLLGSRARFSGASGGSRADCEVSRESFGANLAPDNLARDLNGEAARTLC